MKITTQMIEAASEATGYDDIDAERVEQALTKLAALHTNELETLLKQATDTFDDEGGRGVELADEIDTLRIALAARNVSMN